MIIPKTVFKAGLQERRNVEKHRYAVISASLCAGATITGHIRKRQSIIFAHKKAFLSTYSILHFRYTCI